MSGARIRRGLVALAGGGVLFVALMGFAHTRAGRPLLAAMGRVMHGGACPLGYDRAASPAQREAARTRFAATHRGEAPAASRPALGFALDETLRADVAAFMAARGITCRASTGLADLVCNEVPAEALPAQQERAVPRNLWFTFGQQQRLLSVVALSRAASAEPISAGFERVARGVAHDAGQLAAITGDATASALSSGVLRQATAELRFSDYYASARATNMGDGFLLTEEYRSLSRP